MWGRPSYKTVYLKEFHWSVFNEYKISLEIILIYTISFTSESSPSRFLAVILLVWNKMKICYETLTICSRYILGLMQNIFSEKLKHWLGVLWTTLFILNWCQCCLRMVKTFLICSNLVIEKLSLSEAYEYEYRYGTTSSLYHFWVSVWPLDRLSSISEQSYEVNVKHSMKW